MLGATLPRLPLSHARQNNGPKEVQGCLAISSGSTNRASADIKPRRSGPDAHIFNSISLAAIAQGPTLRSSYAGGRATQARSGNGRRELWNRHNYMFHMGRRGLQSRVRRFNSDPGLQTKALILIRAFFMPVIRRVLRSAVLAACRMLPIAVWMVANAASSLDPRFAPSHVFDG